ncbi:uncharacterized protein T551_00142 [Pneumocystis jirovecii RU7]|uniref:Pentacotripeptide-repeat region of PRORP domain-containing protein n=1 Tax=Pneumocystis jirovecii (strain RU7) TaxID=1408657 RepID=A0A0W4ZWB4_PNEJ7|nr:uncharacterized protein T551_00142 [Pneumocystis jirovecii RU7]KTW32657.1 hypothetical protein T551_00142 [Pneumocystis jirovecii RU7]
MYRFLVLQSASFSLYSSNYFVFSRFFGFHRLDLFLLRSFTGSSVFFRKKLDRKCMISDSMVKESFNEKRDSFQYKVLCRDLEAALQFYSELSETGCLRGYDVSKLIALIDYRIKTAHADTDDSYVKSLLLHLENVLNDVYSHRIPGHPMIWVNAINIYINLGLYQAGKEVWEYAKSKYFHDLSSFDSRVYGSAIKLYAFMDSPLDCEALFQEAIHAQNMKESLELYEGIIMARIQNNDKKRALEALYECLDKFKNIVKPKFFDSLIYFATSRGIPKSIVEIVFYFLDLNYLPSPKALTTFFKQLWKYEQDLTTILKIFTKHTQVASCIYVEHINFVLLALFKLTNKNNQTDIKNTTDKVNNLLVLAHKAKIPPNVSTFNTLISGYAFLEQFDLVEKVVQEMKRLSIPENEITLRILLKAYGKKGCSLEEINSIWKRIVKLSSGNSGEIIQQRNWLTLLKTLSLYGKEGADFMVSLLEEYRLQIEDTVFKMICQEISCFNKHFDV